ncbi:hypothetical protein B0T22DRAFT_519665 [Podospora appendiculata]|uniref:Uncharacterized protein n=1 Tax=Podospora appendiculata TaxID=314037 RepID=A0AAE0X332_9PEZI|nr:hypothetical protein B0T22DRAFT_519665 [Podospora appendiculata]
MAATVVTSRDGDPPIDYDQYKEPLSGMVVSVILAMASLVIISAFLTQRFLAVKIWSRLPFVQWLVFAIYADSFLFVFATAIIQFGFGVDHSVSICEAAILLCLACYVTTKLIYLFLVEKAFIIRSGSKKQRLRSRLYIFNTFGMIGVYSVVVVLNFIYRITRVENGQCIIGMKKLAMIPLIAFDLLVNIYLTILFLIPLSSLYSFKHLPETAGTRRLKLVAMRTFVGCVCTLISSIVNLSVLMALDGEPGWVCLMCCNSDILFSAVVIQWVTSRDSMSPTQNDSISLSQPKSHHGADNTRKSRRRSSGRDLEADGISSMQRCESATSHPSPNLTPSTKAMVDDVAEISLTDAIESAPHQMTVSPCSTNNTFCEDGKNGNTSSGDEDDHLPPRMPPPCVPARHSPTEVRVDVDYGSSLSRDTLREGVKLGNSIVIGSDGGRRGRSSSWRQP